MGSEAPGWLVPRSSLAALSIPRPDYLARGLGPSVEAGRGHVWREGEHCIMPGDGIGILGS